MTRAAPTLPHTPSSRPAADDDVVDPTGTSRLSFSGAFGAVLLTFAAAGAVPFMFERAVWAPPALLAILTGVAVVLAVAGRGRGTGFTVFAGMAAVLSVAVAAVAGTGPVDDAGSGQGPVAGLLALPGRLAGLLTALPARMASEIVPAPVVPELLLGVVLALGATAVVLSALLAVRRAPLAALAVAFGVFTAGLAIARPDRPEVALPFLLAAGLVLATCRPTHGGLASLRAPSLVVLLAAALLGAVTLAGYLPGYGAPAVVDLRTGGAATQVATNPMVSVRTALTGQSAEPVLAVSTPRPVYLRTTALEVYGQDAQWRSPGVRAAPIDGPLDPAAGGAAAAFDVDIEVLDLDPVLVPVPFQPVDVGGALAGAAQYDARTATVTLPRGVRLSAGDRYRVSVAPPAADLEAIDDGRGFAPDSALTDLPANVPPEVTARARAIVEAADARTPVQIAFALQDELRSWNYSLTPPPGQTGDALLDFLDTQTGYCEQYAATMAIMLRSLDVPARVAVGFSPGELVDPEAGRWEVSDQNAHAWVEVLLPDVGWIPFEPTPRSDGNVLVPSGETLTPDELAADRGGAAPAPAEAADIPAQQQPPTADEDPSVGEDDGAGAQTEAAAGGPAGQGRSGPSPRAAALLTTLLFALGLAGAWQWRRRWRRKLAATPRGRVTLARRRIERLGVALGEEPRPHETDGEFLARVSERLGTAAVEPARALAVAAGAGRYAPEVDAATAAAAQRAAADLLALDAPDGTWSRIGRGRRVLVAVMRQAVPSTVREWTGAVSAERGGRPRAGRVQGRQG